MEEERTSCSLIFCRGLCSLTANVQLQARQGQTGIMVTLCVPLEQLTLHCVRGFPDSLESSSSVRELRIKDQREYGIWCKVELQVKGKPKETAFLRVQVEVPYHFALRQNTKSSRSPFSSKMFHANIGLFDFATHQANGAPIHSRQYCM